MFKTLMIVSSLMLPFCAVAQAADWEGVFEGTLGKAKVLVELNAGDGKSDYEGGISDGPRYSYLPKVRDINLILTEEGDELKFTETLLKHFRFADEAEADRKITGHWTLRVDDDGAKGTWTSPKGDKKLPITLRRAELLERPNADTNDLTHTYEQIWAKTLRFSDAGTEKTYGPVEVRRVRDSAFGAEFPVLGAFPDAGRKDKANAKLLEAHTASLITYRSCINGVEHEYWNETTEPDFANTVTFASETLLSYYESGSVFCGGAHPNNYVQNITYDLVTPSRMGGTFQLDLSTRGFGRLLKLGSKEERIAFERFALGRWKDAAMKDPDMSECQTGWIEETAEGEKEFQLSFTEAGLAISRTDFPHVASVCMFTDFNPTIIPIADLKPWLKEGQTLLDVP